MSQKSVSNFLVQNVINIVAVILMVSLIAQYFIKEGLPYGYGNVILVAFSNGATWALFMGSALLVWSISREMSEKRKWWWHNIILFLGMGVGMVTYVGLPSLFNSLFYVFGVAGLGVISSLSGFSLVVGITRKIRMSSKINTWIIGMIIIGLIPFTPIADIIGKTLNDALWGFALSAGLGPISAMSYVGTLATIAFAARAIILVEKIGREWRRSESAMSANLTSDNLRRVLTEDVRGLYLILLILIVVGSFIVLPVTVISPQVARAYADVDKLKPGDRIFFLGNWRSVMYPESWAAFQPVLKHLLSKGVNFVIVSTQLEGVPVDDILMTNVWGPDWKNSPDYGTKFVYLGFLDMGSASPALVTMTNFKALFPVDYKGTSLNNLPLTKNVKDASSFSMVIGIGSPLRNFASYWGVSYHIPTLVVEGAGTTFWSTDYWVIGLMDHVTGARFGAEYETLLGYSGLSHAFMGGDGLETIFVLALIIIFNAQFLRGRLAKKEVTK